VVEVDLNQTEKIGSFVDHIDVGVFVKDKDIGQMDFLNLFLIFKNNLIIKFLYF
jgi:hypothetical protein